MELVCFYLSGLETATSSVMALMGLGCVMGWVKLICYGTQSWQSISFAPNFFCRFRRGRKGPPSLSFAGS